MTLCSASTLWGTVRISEVITGPLARLGIHIHVQEVFESLAAPCASRALVWAVLQHPAAVSGDVAQILFPVAQGELMAVELLSYFPGLFQKVRIRARRLSVSILMLWASGSTRW